MRNRLTLLKAYTKITLRSRTSPRHLAWDPCVPRNNMSMLSTFHSRKPNHKDTQKFDENEVYKIQVKLADPAAVQQFNADMAIIGIDMTKAWNHWLLIDSHWDAAAKLLAVLKNMPEIEAGPEYHGVRWKHGDVQASMRGNFIRFEGDPKAIIDKISAALSARQPPVKHIMMTKKIRDIEFAPKFYPNLFEMFDVKAANIAAWKAHNAHLLDPAPNVTANAAPPPMQQPSVVQMPAAGGSSQFVQEVREHPPAEEEPAAQRHRSA